MSKIRQALFRLRSVFRRKAFEIEMSEEIRTHLEMQTDANIAAGMTPDEALYAAQRDFGGVDQVKERYRDERRPRWLEDSFRDLRHSVRALLRERAFSATVLAIFALCVAANVAIFSVVDEILLRPLPFPEPLGVYSVYNSYPKAGFDGGTSVPHFLERSREITTFAESAAYRTNWRTVGERGSSRGIESMATTSGFFSLLGTNAALGRTYTDGETAIGNADVVVLSDEFWRSRFNADPAVLGKTLRIDDVPYTVIGVMPASFRFPTKHPLVWTPLVFTNDERTDLYRHADSIDMFVRLRPGVSVAQVQIQLDELNRRTLKLDPFAKMVVEGAGYHPVIRSLHTVMVDGIRPILLLLQAGAFFLLLIGAVNLANLFMVRSVGRAREYSVRRALGAGSARLGRSLVLETILLSVTGGAVGLGIGLAALRETIRYFNSRLPFEVPVQPDWTVCIVTLAGSVLTGLLLSVPVLWQSLRGNLTESLSAESRSGTTTRSVQSFRQGLIIAQIALAFVLLSGTGFLSLSLSKVLSVNPGFRPQNVLTGMVALPDFRFPEAKRTSIVLRISERIRGLPGVSSSGIATPLPFTWSGGAAIAFKNHKLTDEEKAQPHAVISVAGDYFNALGVPLVKGRYLSDSDVEAGRKVCVVDANFAQRYWPKGDALGGGITTDSSPNAEFDTIVGIVGSVKQLDLADEKDFGMIYLPFEKSQTTAMIALRTTGDPDSLGATLSKAVAEVDPDLAAYDVKPMTSRIDGSLSGRRLSLGIAGLYAGVSLLLATIGIYGVLAYTVAQRRREIGVRMALGARPDQILRMVLGSGLRMLAFSLPAGAIGAVLIGRVMAGFLYGVSPTHVGVLAAAGGVLAVAATAACLIPARRAAQVAPAEALRTT